MFVFTRDTHVDFLTMTGNFSLAPVNCGLAMLRFRQFSDTSVMLTSARGGDSWPSGCGHAGPGLVALIVESGTGT